MTLFSFEGPSRSGKTTARELLEERRPEWVQVVGPSLPERTSSDFKEAWRREMQLRCPIFEANPDNVFLANRQFSELAYTNSDEVRDYVKRTLAMWGDVHIIYLTANQDILDQRNSPDKIEIADKRYQPILDAFPNRVINTGGHSPETVADLVEDYVEEVMS